MWFSSQRTFWEQDLSDGAILVEIPNELLPFSESVS